MSKKHAFLPSAVGHSVQNLFANNLLYEVPGFQRGYTWGEEEVKKLLSDLATSFQKRKEEPYLLGQTILCATDSDRLSIVDGQQRMTTLSILCAIAVAELDKRGDVTPNRVNQLATYRLALIEHFDEEHEEPRILVTENARSHYSLLLSGSPLPEKKDTYSEENIQIAYDTISNFLEINYTETADLFALLSHIFSRAYVLELRLDDMPEAIRTFATMNHRGRDLDDADLIKNLLFQQVEDPERFENISQSWDTAARTLYQCRLKRLKPMDFLLGAMIGIKTGNSIPSDEVFEEWMKHLETADSAWDFALGLPHQAQVLQNLSFAKTPRGEEVEEVFGSNSMNWIQHLEVLLAGKHLLTNSYKELARVVDARVMLSQFSGEKNQEFERLVHKWASKVSDLNPGATRAEILAASDDVLQPIDVVANIKRLRDQLDLLNYKVGSHKSKIRYVLARCVIALQDQNLHRQVSSLKDIVRTSKGVKGVKAGFDIDHVFPDSDKKSHLFPMKEVEGQPTRAQVLNSIGNLILLHPSDNRSQQDTLPNDEKKQKNLAGSQLFINALLTNERLWGPNLTSNKSVREGMLEVQGKRALLDDEWGPESIKARKKTYFNLFAEDILRDLDFDFNKYKDEL
jgi:hypothetical protein